MGRGKTGRRRWLFFSRRRGFFFRPGVLVGILVAWLGSVAGGMVCVWFLFFVHGLGLALWFFVWLFVLVFLLVFSFGFFVGFCWLGWARLVFFPLGYDIIPPPPNVFRFDFACLSFVPPLSFQYSIEI